MQRYVSGTIWGFLCAVALMAALSGCGTAATLSAADLPDPSPYAAQETDQYPFAVAVFFPGRGGICSGVRLAENIVLTAAHCTKRSGDYVISNAYFYGVAEILGRNSDGEVGNPLDIAVLRLKSITRDDAPSDLPRFAKISTAEASLGQVLRLTGVGCNDVESFSGVGTMRSGTNLVFQITSFLRFYTPRDLATGRRVAGPENLVASCAGDSGGGWVEETEVAGEAVFAVKAIVHAGGNSGNAAYSEASKIVIGDNMAFLQNIEADGDYGIDFL